jgi:hypothetical protein
MGVDIKNGAFALTIADGTRDIGRDSVLFVRHEDVFK